MPGNNEISNQRKATMTSNDEISNDEVRNFGGDEEYDEESLEGEEALSAEDQLLFDAINANSARVVQQLIQNGADVNTVRNDWTPLMKACGHGFDQIVRLLLDAGADARWKDSDGCSAILGACETGHLSTVQLLMNHDNDLLEISDHIGSTPLIVAIQEKHYDIVRFLLDSGANASCADTFGETPLMHACKYGRQGSAWLLLAAGVDLEARNQDQRTALHKAALFGTTEEIEVVRALIFQHNANMFALDEDECTPFDLALCENETMEDALLVMYGNKLTQDHGQLALHELLKVAEYSFADEEWCHPPLNPLRIILPLGDLTLKHWRTVIHTFDTALIHNRDDSGKLPIHIACQTNAPVGVLFELVEPDSATLQIADNNSGSLPVHLCCSGVADYACLRYLVEQGGVGTLAARNHQGALPLHVLCGSTNPSWRAVQYLIQSFPGSVTVQTYAGEYPFMMAAAAESSSSSLSVIYELVRANPRLVVPK